MLVGIHQLHYLPWLRYIEKIARSDVFVVLDNIQFTKNDWQNRNKVKTAAGATVLTVPVFEHLGQTLDEVTIKNSVPWRKKHARTIEQNYARAPFFEAHRAFLADIYAKEWTHLNALSRHMLDYFVYALGIDTPLVYASDLDVTGAGSERLVALVRAVGGDTYYSGAFAIEQYLDRGLFEAAGIGLEAQEWIAPTYPQRHGAFVRDLAILDLLLNCGPESLNVLCGGTP